MANNVAYALETVISGGVKIKNKVGMENIHDDTHGTAKQAQFGMCVSEWSEIRSNRVHRNSHRW